MDPAKPPGRAWLARSWLLAAFIAGTSLTLTSTSPAHAQQLAAIGPDAQQGDVRPDQDAIPVVPQSDKIVLPRPLSAEDAGLYQRMFQLQADGRYVEADRLAALLSNRSLLGHVLAARYLDDDRYKAGYQELVDWLVLYGDYPRADKIYSLARKRAPKSAAVPKPVDGATAAKPVATLDDGSAYVSPLSRPKAIARKVNGWRSKVASLVRQGKATDARALLTQGDILPYLDETEISIARWQVARGLLALGDVKGAFPLAASAAMHSSAVVPQMAWTAGLLAWRVEDYAAAQKFFTDFTNRRGKVPEDAAMGAFWAARASLAANRPQLVARFMRISAATGDSFYGRLAQAVLGAPPEVDAAEQGLADRSTIAVLRYAAGRRALALGQIGRADLAQYEIALLARRHDDPALSEGLWSLADALDIAPEATGAIAVAASTDADKLYPVPRLSTKQFKLDRALVLAVIRAESGFDHRAESAAGARGLMQLMPETAAMMAKQADTAFDPDDLHDPATSLRLGQRYIRHLMNQKDVGSNLIYVIAAYNAGPARITQWRERFGDDDPLFFMESIPFQETRNYVREVLSAYWGYQERFKQATTSLDELRDGSWPTYRERSGKQAIVKAAKD